MADSCKSYRAMDAPPRCKPQMQYTDIVSRAQHHPDRQVLAVQSLTFILNSTPVKTLNVQRREIKLAMQLPLSSPVVIVGAGAFGLSTALHLSRAGYTDITVLDKDGSVPPQYSAANDLNKIIRAEYEDSFYRDLTLVGAIWTISSASLGNLLLIFIMIRKLY